MPKYHVITNGNEEYDVTADSILVDDNNSNRVTFVKSNGQTVAQENDAKSVRPA